MPTTTRRPVYSSRAIALVATLVVGAGLAWSARAQTPAPAESATTAAVRPAAGDGNSTRLSSAQVQQAFQYMDVNRDGTLTRGEVSKFPRIEKHFERIDSNQDGTVSPGEFEEALQQAS